MTIDIVLLVLFIALLAAILWHKMASLTDGKTIRDRAVGFAKTLNSKLFNRR